MQNYRSDLGSRVTIIMGVAFVVCVLLFRRDIVGDDRAPADEEVLNSAAMPGMKTKTAFERFLYLTMTF